MGSQQGLDLLTQRILAANLTKVGSSRLACLDPASHLKYVLFGE
jgi:hypothetical protein